MQHADMHDNDETKISHPYALFRWPVAIYTQIRLFGHAGRACYLILLITKVSNSRISSVWNREMPKFFCMSMMMFMIIYIYTTVRDTKDTLVVSTCVAESLTFLKVTLLALPRSFGNGYKNNSMHRSMTRYQTRKKHS